MKTIKNMKKIILSFVVLIFSAGAFPQSKFLPCPKSTSTKWNRCVGSMTDESGSRYEGEWENGKPHGKGAYISNEKLKIVGEFKNGLIKGKATISESPRKS